VCVRVCAPHAVAAYKKTAERVVPV